MPDPRSRRPLRFVVSAALVTPLAAFSGCERNGEAPPQRAAIPAPVSSGALPAPPRTDVAAKRARAERETVQPMRIICVNPGPVPIVTRSKPGKR